MWGTVKKVLVTGIPGIGKSTLANVLAARGYKALDADTDEWCEWVKVEADNDEYGTPVEPNRDWMWREERIQVLLSTEDSDILFVCGCAANMRRFLPQFDHVILLSVPGTVIIERLAARTNNPYGKHPDEVARVLNLKETVEPILRSIADTEINTNAPLDEIVATVLRVVT